LINVGPITLTGTWQIGGAGASPGNEIRSSMSGVGSLDILGSFLVLSGVNTYSGATILGTGATLKASGRVRFLPLPASRSQAEPYWI
jgi:hypothetical protein